MNNLIDPRITLLGNSSIGIFGFSTSNYAFFPSGIKQKSFKSASGVLDTHMIVSSVSDTNLNGLLSVGNTNHLLLPNIISDSEYNTISDQIDGADISLSILESKITALGNSIVVSDKVALVHKDFTIEERSLISDLLDVEVESKSFLGSPLLGSMIILSSKGFLTHPMFSEDEIENISSYFNVPGDVVTVNRGLPYPRLGIIANDNGVLVGSDTTGPEILRITEILG